MKRKIKIPRIPHAFFKWYCRKERYEELHGDLEELYNERVTELGLAKARLYYLLDVIRCCQPYAWKKPKSQTNSNIVMFKNYSKTSLRSLMKNPLSSFINIFGLSVAIGISLIVYVFIKWDYSIDQFHENKNEVYLSTFYVDRDGSKEQYGTAPAPLGEMLREDFSHIKKVCRIKDGNVVLKHGDKVFRERVLFTDSEYLEMFTFPLKWGISSALADVNSIILSEEMSFKYFGKTNPIGQDILMIFGDNRQKEFTIKGVAEAFPKAHAIEFDFLINFQNLQTSDPDYSLHDWSEFINATLIQVDNPSDLEIVEGGMEKYRILQNEVQEDWAISSFTFQQLAGLREKSVEIRDSISYNYLAPGRVALPVIALFMLALACFNYINIAIVSASKRLKEIGVRKVIGANRGRVIIQFLAENLFVTFFALILGVILGLSIFLPWFIQLSSLDLDIQLIDKDLWIFLLSLLLVTGLASGIYPAFYISKFDVVTILKGSARFGKKNPLTKTLLGFQLVFSCILIVGAVIFSQNLTYQSNLSWGYNQKEALYVNVPDKSSFEQLNAAMIQNPNVLMVSGSSHHLGKEIATTVAHRPDRQYEVHQLSVDANYFEAMELKLTAGRVFRDHHKSDKQAVVVNELLVRKMALDEPIGQVFKVDSISYEVVGVVKDFHFYSFYSEIYPTIFKVADPNNYRYLSMRVRSGSEKETYDAVKALWATLFPEIPFQGGHQEDVWGDGYIESEGDQVRFNKVVAFIAVLLTSLGFYGLVTLNVSGRVREFSIRKALGAGLKNIASDVTRQYFILTAVALIIGIPISYVLVEALMNMLYVYPMPMAYSGIAIAVLILLSVLLAVASTQIRKVSKSNPVAGLKVE